MLSGILRSAMMGHTAAQLHKARGRGLVLGCSRLYIAVIFVAHESLPKASGSFPAMLRLRALIIQLGETQLDEQLQLHVPMEIESTVPGGRGRMAGVPAYRAGVTRHGCCTSAASGLCAGDGARSEPRTQTRLNHRLLHTATS